MIKLGFEKLIEKEEIDIRYGKLCLTIEAGRNNAFIKFSVFIRLLLQVKLKMRCILATV